MDTSQQVEQYLAASGPSTAQDIGDHILCSQSALSRALLKLANAGTISILSFPQKLYTAKRKPLTLKALLATQLCTIMKLHDAYDTSARKLGPLETDRKLIEALRNEMLRWSAIINEHEDELEAVVAK